ncbi:MAG TPA: GntR family transcriptional regulator [Thermoleophilia bacterium]
MTEIRNSRGAAGGLQSPPPLPGRPSTAVSARTGSPGYRDRHSHEPAYLHIANTMTDRIGSGVYRAGDQVPTEAQLRLEFGVSPMTVRRAISILLDRGLVTTTQGKGTFVRSLDLGEAVFRLQELTDVWAGDASVGVLLLEARIVPAGEKAAAMLECATGAPTVYMRRLIQRRGVPLIYQLEHVVYDERRPLVEAQLQITSLDGLLRSAGGEGIPSGQLTVQAVSLDADAAALLGVAEGSPAFCLEHLFRDFEGCPVSWGWFLCRADQFRLSTSIGVTPRTLES